jgi:hypothetical protein
MYNVGQDTYFQLYPGPDIYLQKKLPVPPKYKFIP